MLTRLIKPWSQLALAALALSACVANELPAVEQPNPPPLTREFRGLWIATVANGDWPSRKDLSAAEQKAELIAILDKAAQLNCNAIFLQVRPMFDAFYESKIEPWSEYLSGEMGKAPSPLYDPLAFAVSEAHQRGLELHAWFNPYRVRGSKNPAAPNHVSKTHPELVRSYGKYLWLDPTDPGTRDYSLKVIRDVVRRYDIDGVHFDDYFYPYKEKDAQGKPIDFPDDAQWQRYRVHGGQLARPDWRRDNVNAFVVMVQKMVRKEKPWVKFGISPFGIWQSGHPAGIKGLSSFDSLFADSRKWLAAGWVDYLAPQLYWPIDSKEQSYPLLLNWWAEQSAQHRHVWPGMALGRKGGSSAEVIAEIAATRKQPGASGNILWHAKTLLSNRNGVADALAKQAYAQPALVPACPWLNSTLPAPPKVRVAKDASALKVSWQPGGGKVWLWALQAKKGGSWTTTILPGEQLTRAFKAEGSELPEAVAVTAINRFGNASPAVVDTVK